MDRREHLKLLLSGSFGVGIFATTSCSEADRIESEELIAENTYGRLPEELALDEKLNANVFFTVSERKTIEALTEIIIPGEGVSGGAVESGVPDFIEFMMKDIPSLQVPTRGGIMWLDYQAKSRFAQSFVDCDSSQQLELIEDIAWPDTARPEMGYGVRFFNNMRNLTSTGYFTSEIGMAYLGYAGNQANVWNGVPDYILKKHGLSYDQKTLNETVKPEDRSRIVEWDEDGKPI